ncbi:anthrone oxygenase family protein [Actinocorallia populi]|uniref:anthrone oxygenase family protein n=1 Tax=Actinocorallia populi TaxID=2079200 RepID=UPI000D08EDAE|nr:anthrone oxygenase family protein [Actinocorallia populi]
MNRTLLLVSAVGAGVSGGVFFAFSTFIMRGLGSIPPAQGAAAMQAINRAAPNPFFMLALLGTAVTGVIVGFTGLRDMSAPGAVYAVVGAALYLIPIVLTVVYHVPYNNQLEALDATAAGTADFWTTYVSRWTAFNHLRCLGALSAGVAFVLAYRSAR